MRLAIFSPLNPQQSGISDYTEELLPHLAAEAEIDLFVDGFTPTGPEIDARFRRFDYVKDPAVLRRLDEYDAVVYHIGNDHRYHAGIREVALAHPGIVVLHDFALQDFFLGLARVRGDFKIYLDEMQACHGSEARAAAEAALTRGGTPPQVAVPTAFPLNARLAQTAEAIIVHSEWSRERLAKIAPGVAVARVQMPVKPHAAAHTHSDANGEPSGTPATTTVQLASFGLITPGKGIEHALRALAALGDEHDFHYTLVGEPNAFFDIRELVRAYGMTGRVTITGHVSLEEFERRIAATDIALNMRERTVGETSASLCRIMAAGVAAVVSNTGWFAELPGDAVVKIDMDEYADALLYAYLKRLMEDAPFRARIGANARRYALAEHAIEQSAADYLAFIRETVAQRARRRFVSSVAREVARLGISADEDDILRSIGVEVAALAPLDVNASLIARGVDDEGNGARKPSEKVAATTATPAATVTSLTTATSAMMATSATTSAAMAQGALESPVHAAAQSHQSSESPRSALQSSSATESRSVRQSSSVSQSGSVGQSGSASPSSNGRLRAIEGIDYKRAAIEYPQKLDAERYHYLLTKPFYNLANKPEKHTGDGMDVETHRHFCDFANIAVALALPAGGRILDVGCGSGWLCEYFARLGYDATGIDISPDLIEAAEARLHSIAYTVDHETPLRYCFATHDIESAPLDEKFDAVICYDSLHHFVDEHAVFGHLASMLDVGGFLFVLEGDKPPEGSATEDELVGVMEHYETLESPFSPEYLRGLLDAHGFAVVGDYVSINGLFARDELDGDRLRVEPAAVNYLLCKKVADAAPASTVADSRAPRKLQARIELRGEWPEEVAAGDNVRAALDIENTGDTLWLVGHKARRGVVMLGVRLFDAAGNLVSEFHGQPLLPRALAPGERVGLAVELDAPRARGAYRLKIDMVDQQVCWFEEHGSTPLELSFTVS